jgi:hypothetical protein
MEETRTWMQINPVRPIGLGDLSVAEYAWVIKWCLDMKAMEEAAARGKRIHFVREEDLMNNTRKAIQNILDDLRWQWTGDIGTHFPVYCRFMENSTDQEPADITTAKVPGSDAYNDLILSFGIKTYTTGPNRMNTFN